VTDGNEAAWRGAEAIVEMFRSLEADTRREVGLSLHGHESRFLSTIGPAVALYGESVAVRTIASAIVIAVFFDEAAELVDTLPAEMPWTVVRAALQLAIREGVDIQEFVEDDARTMTVAEDTEGQR
jgi:hypothetical protein